MNQRSLCVLAAVISMIAACTPSKNENKNATPTVMTDAQLNERGKAVYMSTCIACHNSDPHKDGSLGPAIYGSSQALIEARVLNASYPDGYKPKRDTKVMSAFPYLKSEIPALYKFLNSSGE